MACRVIENVPEMIAWLAEHIQKLEKAFSPWVPKMAGWVREAERLEMADDLSPNNRHAHEPFSR
jgi:hypothetical protein